MLILPTTKMFSKTAVVQFFIIIILPVLINYVYTVQVTNNYFHFVFTVLTPTETLVDYISMKLFGGLFICLYYIFTEPTY